MKVFFCIAFLLNCLAVADTGANHTPFWLSKKMVDEPVLFIGDEGNRSGRLIFTPASMPVLTRAGDSFVYEAGKDYTWEKEQPYNQADGSFQNSIQDTAGDETWTRQAKKPRWCLAQ